MIINVIVFDPSKDSTNTRHTVYTFMSEYWNELIQAAEKKMLELCREYNPDITEVNRDETMKFGEVEIFMNYPQTFLHLQGIESDSETY